LPAVAAVGGPPVAAKAGAAAAAVSRVETMSSEVRSEITPRMLTIPKSDENKAAGAVGFDGAATRTVTLRGTSGHSGDADEVALWVSEPSDDQPVR
jgi:hypothetical protein